ncbi:MAG: hypothetical protein C5B49_12470 [Bdellovibrio sp.]|nr:MAG: hypothetical protein C5B49_12470 [Bdellovibrio sp.]
MASLHARGQLTVDFQQIFERALNTDRGRFSGRLVLDVPAGEGRTTQWLLHSGARVIPMDLFPAFYKLKEPTCQVCDLNERIGLSKESVDFVISQEGIEHLPNQLFAMMEFSRVLKRGGRLLLTTPNQSNMTAKLSYLFSESERFGRIMPPNTVDGLWFNSRESGKIYFGHLFLSGVCHLNVLAEVAGFRLERIHFTRLQPSCLLPFLFLYPWMALIQLLNLRRNLRKNPEARREYWKVFWLSINPKILLDGTLMLEFTKEQDSEEAKENLYRNWHQVQKNRP